MKTYNRFTPLATGINEKICSVNNHCDSGCVSNMQGISSDKQLIRNNIANYSDLKENCEQDVNESSNDKPFQQYDNSNVSSDGCQSMDIADQHGSCKASRTGVSKQHKC